MDDFDLTEEPLAKPLTEKIFSQVKAGQEEDQEMEQTNDPMDDIVEEDGDGDWEDVDGEDGEEEKAASSTQSFQKVSAPSSSSYTMIDPSGTQTSDPVIVEEGKSMGQNTNLSEEEANKLLHRRKRMGKVVCIN